MHGILRCHLVTACFCMVLPCEVVNAQRPQENPYRSRETFVIVFDLANAQSGVMQHLASVCEVDLLALEYIQKDLKLSSSSIQKINSSYKRYQELVYDLAIKNQTSYEGFDEEAKKELDDAKHLVLQPLNARTKRRLLELDRYLFVRRFGPTRFLSVFFADRMLPDNQQRRLTASEDRIRTRAYQQAEERWHETLDNVRSHLEETPEIQKEFSEQIETFQSSLFADICLVDLESPDNEKIKSNGDPDDEFLDLLQRFVQLNMGFDGSWKYRIIRDDSMIYDNFSFLCTRMWPNPFKPELGNDLEMLDYQVAESQKLQHAYFEKINQLSEKKRKGIIDANEQKRLKTELAIPVVEKIFNDVMLPHQRRHLETVLNQHRMVIAGPARLLLLESISADIRDEIENEYEQFRDALVDIEIQTQQEYLELIQEYAGSQIGFDSESRPGGVVPSHSLLRRKENRLKRKEPEQRQREKKSVNSGNEDSLPKDG